MKPTTRFFLKAAALAVVLSVAGYGYAHYTHGETVTAQAECKGENDRMMVKYKAEQAKNPALANTHLLPLTCDPYDLSAMTIRDPSYVPTGVEGRLLSTFKEEHKDIAEVLYGIAAFIVFIGALPVVWYFFLARLAEVAAAVRRG